MFSGDNTQLTPTVGPRRYALGDEAEPDNGATSARVGRRPMRLMPADGRARSVATAGFAAAVVALATAGPAAAVATTAAGL